MFIQLRQYHMCYVYVQRSRPYVLLPLTPILTSKNIKYKINCVANVMEHFEPKPKAWKTHYAHCKWSLSSLYLFTKSKWPGWSLIRLIRTKTKHISYVRVELIFMWPVNGLVTNDFCVLSSHILTSLIPCVYVFINYLMGCCTSSFGGWLIGF